MNANADETISILHHCRYTIGIVRQGFEKQHPPRLVLATRLATAQNEITDTLKELEHHDDPENCGR